MKQSKIFFGIIAGLAVVGYALLFYFFNKNWLWTGGFFFSSLLIYAFFMHKAAARRKESDFKVVLQTAFVVFLLANLMYYAFDFWLYNMFDKNLASQQAEAAIAYLNAATPSDEQDKMAENIRSANIHDVKSLLIQFGRGAIGGFGLALAITMLVKRHN